LEKAYKSSSGTTASANLQPPVYQENK